MALSDIERAKIRGYLGFSAEARTWNPRLEGRMDDLGQPALSGELALVRELLGQLDRVSEEFYVSGGAFQSAGIKKVDEVEFFGTGGGDRDRYGMAQSTGRMLCGQLSIRMGVPLVGDWFSGEGYQGDGWASSGFQSGVLRLG